jgi:hypothetical protein
MFRRGEAGEFAVTKILYDGARQKAILRETIAYGIERFDKIFAEVATAAPKTSGPILNEVLLQSAMLLLTAIVRFKHPAFESEEEWRVFKLDRAEELSEVHYRMCGPRLVPYIELVFEPDLITDIVRSPGLWPASTDYALKRLGASLGHHVRVDISKLPI